MPLKRIPSKKPKSVIDNFIPNNSEDTLSDGVVVLIILIVISCFVLAVLYAQDYGVLPNTRVNNYNSLYDNKYLLENVNPPAMHSGYVYPMDFNNNFSLNKTILIQNLIKLYNLPLG